jgi:S-adenosylmethionine hydrolase
LCNDNLRNGSAKFVMSGVAAIVTASAGRAEEARLTTMGRTIGRVRTFSDVPVGTAFWYENSNGLAEIGINQGRADRELGLAVGSPVAIAT